MASGIRSTSSESNVSIGSACVVHRIPRSNSPFERPRFLRRQDGYHGDGSCVKASWNALGTPVRGLRVLFAGLGHLDRPPVITKERRPGTAVRPHHSIGSQGGQVRPDPLSVRSEHGHVRSTGGSHGVVAHRCRRCRRPRVKPDWRHCPASVPPTLEGPWPSIT